MNEQALLLDCGRRLNRAAVEYMLTGSMASNAWGIPRTTHDLDYRITPSDRQLGDVSGVMEVQRGKLDEAYLREWAKKLGVSDQLEAGLSGQLRPKRT